VRPAAPFRKVLGSKKAVGWGAREKREEREESAFSHYVFALPTAAVPSEDAETREKGSLAPPRSNFRSRIGLIRGNTGNENEKRAPSQQRIAEKKEKETKKSG